eukprot:6316791-Lingulodinium_polyedra.AAC.1
MVTHAPAATAERGRAERPGGPFDTAAGQFSVRAPAFAPGPPRQWCAQCTGSVGPRWQSPAPGSLRPAA